MDSTTTCTPEAGPIDLGRVLDGENLDASCRRRGSRRLPAFTSAFSWPEHGVVLQQVRQRFGIGQIVGRDEFDFRIIESGADHISSDAAEAIDSYFYWHILLILRVKSQLPRKSSMKW